MEEQINPAVLPQNLPQEPKLHHMKIPAVQKQVQPQVYLKMDEAKEVGTYSNAITIHTTPSELVIDFGYFLPKMNPQDQEVVRLVQRMIVPVVTMQQFSKILTQVLATYTSKPPLQPMPQNNTTQA